MVIKLVLILGAMSISFGSGWQVSNWRYDSLLAKEAKQQKLIVDGMRIHAETLTQSLLEAKRNKQTIYVDRIKKVTEYVETNSNDCLVISDDGVSVLEAASSETDPAAIRSARLSGSTGNADK